MRSAATTLVPFTPSAVAPDVLDERTVGRSEVLDRLLEAARAATRGDDRRHTLLVAPRGGGKTHVLCVFAHRLRSDPDLAEALAVVVVDEDAADIVSYADLLVAIVEHLAPPAAYERAQALRRAGRGAELERLVLESAGQRPLVLVLENLDRLFADFGTDGQRRLRALVETSRAIMLVASTPALFMAVSKQSQPWFGSFTVERLAPWNVDEGTAFLERIARDRGDAELAALIASDVGRARLIAVDRLVGGLPRLWTILAGCLTVELLDELVPLVLATLEELVPYYQARLNELAPNERKLVVALCRAETLGGAGGRTVTELAVAAGVPTGSAPKLMRRLEESGWVTGTKPPGTDRRATWYEIREPLLRYHLAYRRQAGEPLSLIVAFLRAWFSPVERRNHLARAEGGTLSETYLVESLRDSLQASDSLYAAASPIDLLTGAREWFAARPQTPTAVRSGAAAIVAEVCALIATGQADVAEQTLSRRLGAMSARGRPALAEVGRAARAAALRARADLLEADAVVGRQSVVLAGLDAAVPAAGCCAPEDEIAISLLANGWRGAIGDAAGAFSGLTALAERARVLDRRHAALRLAVEAQQAYFGCAVSNSEIARARVARVLAHRERMLGRDHPDTLSSRHNFASWTGEAGDAVAARDRFAVLVDDRERVLGRDHPDTLSSRYNFASWTGEVGDAVAARDRFAVLVDDRGRVLGSDHPDTLSSRYNLAYWTGEAGDPVAARDQFAALVPDCVGVLGSEHSEGLRTRQGLAFWTGEAGDAVAARDQFAALVPDCERVLGRDHRQTLSNRFLLTYWTGEAKKLAFSRELGEAIAAASERLSVTDRATKARLELDAPIAVAMARPNHAAKRDGVLDLLARERRRGGQLVLAQVLDGLFVAPTPLGLEAIHVPDRDWLAISHVLRVGAQGAGLAAVVRIVADEVTDGRRLARRLVQTAATLTNGVANLTTSILAAADGEPWDQEQLERWLEHWETALTDVPAAQIAAAALDAIGREARGDSTARPSLPPELRDIVPRVRLVGASDADAPRAPDGAQPRGL